MVAVPTPDYLNSQRTHNRGPHNRGLPGGHRRLPVITTTTPERITDVPELDDRPAEAREYRAREEQDCARCRLATHCWRPLSVDQTVANLLVCRLKRGIDPERSWQAFLALIQPKLLTETKRLLAGDVHYGTREERRADFLADLHIAVIEALRSYQLGDRSHPLAWLFQPRLGAVPRMLRGTWQKRDVRRRYSTTPFDSSPASQDMTYLTLAESENDEDGVTEHDLEVATVLGEFVEIAEDGRTLTTAEYRAYRLAVDNLHRPLKDDTPYAQRVTRTSLRGLRLRLESITRKILEVSGRIEDVAQRVQVTLPDAVREARRARAHGAVMPISDAERQLVRERPDVADRDWAILLGVDAKTIWVLRRARGTMSR